MTAWTINIESSLEQEITQLAQRQHKTRDEVIHDLLRRECAIQNRHLVHARAMPYEAAAGYLNENTGPRDGL